MNLISFQQSIGATGTAQQLPNYPVTRSVTIAASPNNATAIVLGNASSVTTSTGFALQKGQSVTLELAGGNTAAIFAVGTAGDLLSIIGV